MHNSTSTLKELKTRYSASGGTTLFALDSDPRFSYCLYIPRLALEGMDGLPLVVIQHGTYRNVGQYRDAYEALAEEHGWVLLAPLFPARLNTDDGLLNFHQLVHDGVRYDSVLLAMVDQVARDYPVDASRFALHGFSGGGQFAHRFFYCHPERLSALSVGAPGHVTLLSERNWWAGTGNMASVLGVTPDTAQMSKVPVQLVVGANDLDVSEIDLLPEGPWRENAAEIGSNRIERLRSLHRNWAEHGVSARFDVVPGIAHEGLKVNAVVGEFFASVLDSRKAR